jgi:hypothetical protein
MGWDGWDGYMIVYVFEKCLCYHAMPVSQQSLLKWVLWMVDVCVCRCDVAPVLK